jgi:heterodisulfide reductase subunit C
MADDQESVIQIDELEPEFSEEVIKTGGEKLNHCFQCGVCSGSCPITRFDETFNPRRIMIATALGIPERVLHGNTIWLCASCYTCQERCPREVQPADVIRTIRNLAVRRSVTNPYFQTISATIVKEGRLFNEEEAEFFNEIREDMGLPPIPSLDLEEITKIFQHTNVKKLLTTKAEEDEDKT